MNGASKENSGLSSYDLCLRNSQEHLIYARAGGVGNATNIEAESVAIYDALKFCWERKLGDIIIETDLLSLMKITRGQ